MRLFNIVFNLYRLKIAIILGWYEIQIKSIKTNKRKSIYEITN